MNKIKLIALITDQGLLINKIGFADHQAQDISDNDGNHYPAGIDQSGIIYCIKADSDNTILNNDGKRIGWNAFCKIQGIYLNYLKKQVFNF